MQKDINPVAIHLRAMEPEDIDFLYSIENKQEEWFLGSTNMPYSHDILRQYILSTTGDIYTDKQLRLIIQTEQNETAGIIDLTSFDPKNMHAEIGISILPPFRNKGIATEALHQLETYAKQIIHLHMLYAIVPDSNNYSLMLFKNNGFIITGELKQWLFDGHKYQNAQLLQKII